MNISSRFDYALSSVLRVADEYESGRPVPASEIAKKEKIATEYVEQLLTTLKREGVLRSVRGVHGGYVLSKSPDELTLYDVLIAFEDAVVVPVCERKKGRREACAHIDDCRVKPVLLGMGEVLAEYLRKQDLRSLLDRRRSEVNWQEVPAAEAPPEEGMDWEGGSSEEI